MRKKVGYQLSSDELHLKQQSKTHYKDGPVVVAVGLSDSYNVGGVLRCAEAVGSKKVIFVDSKPTISGKKIKKLSRTASDLIDYQFINLEEFLVISQTLPQLVALEITSKSVDIFEAIYPKNITLVIGAEKQGIPEEVLKICRQAIHIPMVGVNSSLNVVSALCVALYDWHRRFRI